MRKDNFVKGNFYHIYIHSISDMKIFCDRKDYERFMSLIFSANGTKPIPRLERKLGLNSVWDIMSGKIDLGNPLVDIVSFSLMRTHFHLLLRERGNANISKYLHKILVSHSKYYNLKYDRRGHLFESKFNSKHIKNNTYLLVVSSYIHKNVKDLPGWKNKEDKYPWSSYQDFVSENRWGHLLKKDIIDSQFNNPQEYKNFVEEHYREVIGIV